MSGSAARLLDTSVSSDAFLAIPFRVTWGARNAGHVRCRCVRSQLLGWMGGPGREVAGGGVWRGFPRAAPAVATDSATPPSTATAACGTNRLGRSGFASSRATASKK